MARRAAPVLTSTQEHQAWQWANVHKPSISGYRCECDADPEGGLHTHLDKVAFEYGPKPLCVSGGFGAAKTMLLSRKALFLSDLYPNNRGVIARKQWTTLKDTTMSTFFKVCPPQAYDERYGGKRVDSEKYLRLARSQSEILWLHLDQDDVEKIIRGLEINWFILDQAEEIPEDVFAMLMTRLGRWDKATVPETVLASVGESKWPWKNPNGRPIVPTYPMIACNPDVFTHWIYRRFHEDSQDHKDRYKDLGYKLITMRSDENRFLPKQNLDEMLQADESFQRRFVRGEWGIPEGQIHEVRDASVIDADHEIAAMLMRKCSMYQSMDHGDASPTCVLWWAIDGDGNVFCLGEYYKGNLLVSDHRRGIKEMNDALIRVANVADFHFKGRYADPSIFMKTQQKYGGRASYADDYEDKNPAHGFRPDDAIYWDAGDNDEMGTRNTINEYLRPQGLVSGDKVEDRIHPITKVKGLWPRLFFLKKSAKWPYGCEHSLTQLRSQRRIRIGMELGKPTFSDERDDTIPDHAYDPVRYFMASRAPRTTVAPAKYSKNSFFGKRDEYLKWKRQQGSRKGLAYA